jgi:ATP synthase protein I
VTGQGAEPSGPGPGGKPAKRHPSGDYRLLATASSIGLSVVVAIFLGMGFGLWLDGRLGTRPWLMVAGLVLGIAAGFRNLYVLAKRIEKAQREDSDGR